MTDKVQKIREEISKMQDATMDKNGNFLSGYEQGVYDALCEIDTHLQNLFIDTLQEEPVSEDLGEYINELSKQFPEVSFAKLSRIAVRVAKWQKEQMMAKAKSGTVQKDNQVILDNGTYIDLDPSMQLKPSFVGLKEGDRIKVIVIKED